ncbi:dihydroorotase [Candidatus Woesearchaeota archaeon]|nr:dihydroorotase [Candidatus Woesearchaeota archaeon]
MIIKNGKVFYKGVIVKKNIVVEGGKIVSFGKGKGESFDASGMVVIPGVIDVHVHFREPGATQKEDFLSGSRAAASGGVTTVIDMPNTSPPTTTVETLEQKRAIAKKSMVNYGFYFGATETNMDEIRKAKNIAGIKVFMGSSTGDLLVTDNTALNAIFACGRPVVVHAEDEAIIKKNAEKYKNEHDPIVHTRIRSNECAEAAVRKAIELAGRNKTKLHILHASTKQEMELIAAAKESVDLSCEATPHHLFLTANDMKKLGNFARMNPPLRSQQDVDALWNGIKNGTIDLVATDHAPHLPWEKDVDYWKAPSGVPGVETSLPLLLNAVNSNRLSLQQLVRLTSETPARRFCIRGKGMIEKGMDADLTVVDLKKEKTIKNSDIVSKCGWTPFNGFKVKGAVIATVVGGQLAYEKGEFGEARGAEIKYGN